MEDDDQYEQVPADEEAPARPGTEARTEEGAVAIRSTEGWSVMVTGIHEDCPEEDLHDFFDNFGAVKNLFMPTDRRTGYTKGYALVEYATVEEAMVAVQSAPKEELFERTLHVDFAFVRPPQEKNSRGRGNRNRGERRRSRSRTPDDR
ncbi:RNA-binding domain-containing protein [Aulographum hederae CBS 113979]|uniref:RNA-binding domain-containing protein n=1 Tax=Aulographum hederae CBS 113979 TaxID=1176131 RepID=A0A6G1GL35_9PEZI|nr:RNA-binding domain-containing protein [Aulographum hederae CBS 113979]